MSEERKGHIPGMESLRAIREHQDQQCAGLDRKQRERAGDLYADCCRSDAVLLNAAHELIQLRDRHASLSARRWTCNRCGGEWVCDRADVPTVSGNHTPVSLCPWCDKQHILDDAIDLAGYVHDLIALAQGRPIRTVKQETMLNLANVYFDNAAIQGHHDAVIDAQRS